LRTRLRRVDPQTRQVAPGPLVGHGASSLTTDGDRVWVGLTDTERVVGFDGRTGHVLHTIDLGARPHVVKADRSGVWVLTRPQRGLRQHLLHYDRRGRLIRDAELRYSHSSLALGAGSVWLAERARQLIVERDMRTLQRRSVVPLARKVSALTFSGGYIWAIRKEEDSVTQIEPRTAALRAHTTFAAGESPRQALVAGGKLFVISQFDHTVRVFDPEDTRSLADPVPVGRNPSALATDGRSVWVTSLVENTLTRLTTG
jgi:DNA-binding beta-propeller fold protein YncE